MTDKAMIAAARALAKTNVLTACPGYDETRFNEDREAYDRMARAAITAWLAAEDEERVERVAHELPLWVWGKLAVEERQEMTRAVIKILQADSS